MRKTARSPTRIGEDVDEFGDVRRCLFDERADRLPMIERLYDSCGQRHHFDAEAGIDRLDLFTE